ncbi:hypothetical protein L7F22_034156 [Adiantum nelumboides]|nr:hypothetical protein [Adiantum nelumboides]
MQRFMEEHGKKLLNDPIIRQRKCHLLNGLDELIMSPQSEATSSLILMDLDEEDQALATKRFSHISPSLNLSKKPFDTYTDQFIPCRFLEVLHGGDRPWSLGNFTLMAPFTEGLILTLLNGKDKQALKIGLQHILEANAFDLVENLIMATPFFMSYFDSNRCKATYGCVVGVKGVISTTGRETNYTAQIWNIHRPFLECGCKHVGQVSTCGDGNVLWFDHALLSFFPGANLKKSTIAFLSWIEKEAQDALKAMHIHLFYREKLKEAIKHTILFNQQPPSSNLTIEVDNFIRQAITSHKEDRVGKGARYEAIRHGRGRGRQPHTPQRASPSPRTLRWGQPSPTDSANSARTSQNSFAYPPYSSQASVPILRSHLSFNLQCANSAKALLYD